MKIEERESTTKYKVYIAEDGTEFLNESSCKTYDDSARCVIRSKLNIKTVDAWDLCLGDEDNPVEICDGKLDDLLMYAALLSDNTGSCFKEEFKDFALNRPKKQSKLLVFFNIDAMPYKVIWIDDLHKRIDDAVK